MLVIPCSQRLVRLLFVLTSSSRPDSEGAVDARIEGVQAKAKRIGLGEAAEMAAIPSQRRQYLNDSHRPKQRTSPRRTCVIPISWSSTTDARWYVGYKSLFNNTGSVGSDACASLTVPKTKSGGVVLRGRFPSFGQLE